MIRYADKIIPVLMNHKLITPEESEEYKQYLQGEFEYV